MKISAAILAVALALLSFGCGGDDSATGDSGTASQAQDPRLPTLSDPDDPHFATVTGGKGRAAPVVVPSDLPPPKELMVRDLEVGSGPIALPGDQVAIRYQGTEHKNGDVQFRGWIYPPSLDYRLGSNGNGEAFEEGIMGMQEGGRRELLIPSRLAFNTGAIDYVVELVRLEPASKPRPSG